MLNQLQRLLVTTGTLSAVTVTILAMATGVDASEATRPATTVADWVARIEAAIVEITNVQIAETEVGLQVVLETADGVLAMPVTTKSGDALILEIPNARLVLPDGNELIEFEPASDIAVVQVTQRAGDRVEISITGTDAAPLAEVSTDASGLTLNLVPGVAQTGEDDEALQLIVTGEEAGSDYFVPRASRRTLRTDVDLRDTPSAVQVIPRQLIEDQGATNIADVVRNASGVSFNSSEAGGREFFIIRGFDAGIYRNGFRNDGFSNRAALELSNIERVEVFKGPAALLFGRTEPAGIINYVTERPLREPAYEVKFTAGSFDFYRPEIDLTGPLTADGDLAYRLNLAYENAGSFRDGVESELFFIAPTLSWDISDNTELAIEFSYLDDSRSITPGIPVLNDEVVDIPLSTVLGDPDVRRELEETRAELYLDHRFSDNLSLNTAVRYSHISGNDPGFFSLSAGDGNNFNLGKFTDPTVWRSFDVRSDLIAEFNTGALEHTILFGVEYVNGDEREDVGSSSVSTETFDIFNFSFDDLTFGEAEIEPARSFDPESFGIYLQNQIAIADNLQLVVGGRFDTFSQETEVEGTTGTQFSADGFSPRVGIVYRPIEPVSLYASYARSLFPNFGTNVDGDPFAPERGTAFEVGVKAEIVKDRLFSTLALYDITLNNVRTPDPDNPRFAILTGQQRSQGIELDIQGEIMPGWNIFAGYAYTDARVTEDNRDTIGNSLFNVPEHNFNLWTKYTIQEGSLAGLGVGAGVFFVDERSGDFFNTSNDLLLDGFTRVDAAISYKRDNYRLGLNFQNIFDAEFITGAAIGAVQPGEPFTVVGSVSVEF